MKASFSRNIDLFFWMDIRGPKITLPLPPPIDPVWPLKLLFKAAAFFQLRKTSFYSRNLVRPLSRHNFGLWLLVTKGKKNSVCRPEVKKERQQTAVDMEAVVAFLLVYSSSSVRSRVRRPLPLCSLREEVSSNGALYTYPACSVWRLLPFPRAEFLWPHGMYSKQLV